MISCSLLIQEMVPASEGTGHIDSLPDISTNDSHQSNHERRISPSPLDDAQIEALRDSLLVLQREKDRLVWCNLRLAKTIEEVTVERDELVAQRDEEFREKLQLQIESLVHHDRLLEVFEEKKSKRFQIFSKCFTLLESVGESLVRIVERIGGDAGKETLPNIELKQDDELIMFMSKTRHVHTLAETLETNILQQEERGRKEKKQLELSIISLTEENRDISSMLRIAIVEKEAAEKATERLRGGGDQQKRAALLQYAEMGLQKVGFGFIMGAPAGNLTESTGSTVDSIVSSSEGEEEVFNSLASTVERMMKNLRLEISQLRQSLEASRSDNERLQFLAAKQAQKIVDTNFQINDFEHREALLSHNIEELISELTETEEDAVRWRVACEMEVEAAKSAMEERDRMISIMEEELGKSKSSMQLMTTKLKLKEELAKAAMAAQEAAEESLRISDKRSTQLQQRIEELSTQLEESESRGERRHKHRVRHVCWPWPALKINSATRKGKSVNRRFIPEMQALLHAD